MASLATADPAPTVLRCVVCRADAAPGGGALCEPCALRLGDPGRLCPDQIECHVAAEAGAPACLVDRWGQTHAVMPRTVLGRADGETHVQIRDPNVSRRHAQLWTTDEGATWSVRDLGSTAGTELNGLLLVTRARVRSGDVIAVGGVRFYFVQAPPPRARRSTIDTLIPPKEILDAALATPTMELTVYEAGLGGRGSVEADGRSVRLPPGQLQLVDLLARRMREDAESPASTRGFVRSSEIIATLQWEASAPDENHLKQLVRRVRQAFEQEGLGDLIEAKAGFGYRLRVMPVPRAR